MKGFRILIGLVGNLLVRVTIGYYILNMFLPALIYILDFEYIISESVDNFLERIYDINLFLFMFGLILLFLGKPLSALDQPEQPNHSVQDIPQASNDNKGVVRVNPVTNNRAGTWTTSEEPKQRFIPRSLRHRKDE